MKTFEIVTNQQAETVQADRFEIDANGYLLLFEHRETEQTGSETVVYAGHPDHWRQIREMKAQSAGG